MQFNTFKILQQTCSTFIDTIQLKGAVLLPTELGKTVKLPLTWTHFAEIDACMTVQRYSQQHRNRARCRSQTKESQIYNLRKKCVLRYNISSDTIRHGELDSPLSSS